MRMNWLHDERILSAKTMSVMFTFVTLKHIKAWQTNVLLIFFVSSK